MAEAVIDVSMSELELPTTPHQPPSSFSFPKRSFGNKNVVFRSCQSGWFRNWSWLHYDQAKDVVLCHLCWKAVSERKMKRGGYSDAAFVSQFIIFSDDLID